MVVPQAHSNAPPLLSPYGTLSGELFQYSSGGLGNSRVAFESLPPPPPSGGALVSNKKCILVGGLSDGLLALPYTQALERVCHANGWSLVQPLLSSSYTGFGHGSLDRDVHELQELLEYLLIHRSTGRQGPAAADADDDGESEAEAAALSFFCLIGHSTGCQDAVHFLKHAADRYVQRLALVVLQAPVSDRESAMMDSDYHENLRIAQQLRDSGQAEEMMPRKCFWAPITARRFLDLQERGGADDYFSSDFTIDELSERLQHVGRRNRSTASSNDSSSSSRSLQVLVAYSGMDEYVPNHVDKRQLTNRIVQAMNGDTSGGNDDNSGGNDDSSSVATALFIDNGNHNLAQGPDVANVLMQKIDEIFKSLN
jgi:Protein of unknown function (DUF1749)